MTLRQSLQAALCAATLVAAGHSPGAAATQYPKLGLYGSIHGDGYPYLLPNATLDTAVISRVARYDEVVLDVSPITPYRPDIAAALRARNPNIQLFAYVLAEDIWPVIDQDSLNHVPTLIWRSVRDLNGFLYDKNTGQTYPGLAINLAKKNGSGQFVVVNAIADLMRDRVIATGVWNGMFTDVFCHGIGWTQQGTSNVIDYAKAGYASVAALDLAWAEAADSLAARLRRDGGPNFVLIGNCGPSSEHAWYDGWMRENFPLQGGGSWYTNMLSDPQGAFADDRDFGAPAHNWIFTLFSGSNGQQYSATNAKRLRFGFASAALSENLHTYGPSDRQARTNDYHNWWFDEYAVDRATGRSSTQLQHTHWLGQATAGWKQMIWAGTNPDAVTNSNFETDVTSGWTLGSSPPAAASLARDATTAGLGSASARISVTASSTVDWRVGFTTVGSVSMFAGNLYTATFWCKASSPRVIHIVAMQASGGPDTYIAVDTAWRQYQVPIQPTQTGAARLSFWMGTQTGDIWLDDVHLQQGATSLYRRDFQYGIVLVNPSPNALQVPLGASFRRILGTIDPVTNDGALVTSATVPGGDALFLLSTSADTIPPATTTDLSIGP